MKGNLTALTMYSDQIAKKKDKEYKKDSGQLSSCRWLTGWSSGVLAITFTEYGKHVSHSCAQNPYFLPILFTQMWNYSVQNFLTLLKT